LLRNHDNAQSTESITYNEVQLGIGEGIGAYLSEFTLPFFSLGWVNLATGIACHSQHQRATTTTTQEAPNTKTSLKENHQQQPREPLQPPPPRRAPRAPRRHRQDHKSRRAGARAARRASNREQQQQQQQRGREGKHTKKQKQQQREAPYAGVLVGS